MDGGTGPILAIGGRFGMGGNGSGGGIFYNYPIIDNAVPAQTGSTALITLGLSCRI